MYPNSSLTPAPSGSNQVIHYALQLLALAVLLVWCFHILAPFLIPMLWGAVFASSFFPIHEKLTGKYRWKNSLSAAFITLVALALLIVPAVFFIMAGASEIKELAENIRNGNLVIPPANEQVKSWPLIGEKAFAFWTEAPTSVTLTIQEHEDQMKPLLLRLVALPKNTAAGFCC